MKDVLEIYGLRAVIEAVQSGQAIDKVWLLKGLKSVLANQLEALLREKKIAHSYVPVERLNRFSSKNHQGAVAQIAPINVVSLELLVGNVKKQNPVFILLDGITDARNFGAIIRVAAATNVSGIIIPLTGSAPINADTVKTSAGGIFNVPIARARHLKDAVYLMQANGIEVIGVTEKADELIYQETLTKPMAIVMGAEDQGISKGLLKILDQQVKIPISTAIDSLNVSVACAVALYEIVRQQKRIL